MKFLLLLRSDLRKYVSDINCSKMPKGTLDKLRRSHSGLAKHQKKGGKVAVHLCCRIEIS